MDAVSQLVWDAEDATAVLGRGEDYLLIPLGPGPIGPDIVEDAKRRGFRLCGALGTVNGRAAAKWEVADPDALAVMVLAVLAFTQGAETKDDSADWLERFISSRTVGTRTKGENDVIQEDQFAATTAARSTAQAYNVPMDILAALLLRAYRGCGAHCGGNPAR